MGNIINIKAKSGEFPVYVAEPDQETKGALIVIHEVWGLADHIKSVADRFAEEGYTALAPDLLSSVGITKELIGDLQEELFDPERRTKAQPKIRALMAPMQAPDFGKNTLDKVQECFKYLESVEGVNDRIGITGFCFGGTYSFSLAVHQPKLKLALPFYGHADFSLEELKNIKCPIMAFYGEKDERLMNELPELKEKMQAAGVGFTAQVYKNCGHAFFNDTNRFTYNQLAATDAWDKALSFIANNL